MGFLDVIKSLGATHYYPLNKEYQARDAIGTVHGANHGAVFGDNGATFNGSSYVEIPSHKDFSAVTTGALSILVFNTINNWKGAGASEYVHWMGKGISGAHEWVFRHYVQGGTGEAATRQYRTSFYCFNPTGGLGAGSYFQDQDAVGAERVIVGQYDKTTIEMWKNGAKRDSDPLSGYNITLRATNSPVRLGTRDMSTGFLVGRLRRVAFFPRKLTNAEILRIYNARGQAEGAPVPAPPPSSGWPTPAADGKVHIGTQAYVLSGVNIARTANALVVYTNPPNAKTPTNKYGVEAVVTMGKVVSVRDRMVLDMPVDIPNGSVVLSGHGEAAMWLKTNARIGSTVQLPNTVKL